MTKWLNKLALAVAGFSTVPAFAQSWYAGVGVGRGTLKDSLVGASATPASKTRRPYTRLAWAARTPRLRLPDQLCSSGLACGMMRSEAAIAMAESRNVM